MVRNEVTRIKIGQTDEPLTGQGGFLAFGEYMMGMPAYGAGAQASAGSRKQSWV